MKTLELFSPAKINLFLHVTAERDDGYHDLQTVFRVLDFGDTLVFRQKSSGDLVSLFGADDLGDVADNLIVKAVRALARRFPAYASPVQIVLDKVIPIGAGLGGGSSNCAMTLIAINELWGLRLGLDELLKIARTLGADVPFFVFAYLQETDAVAMGIGDKLTAIDLPHREYLLLLPKVAVNTAKLFTHPHLSKDTPVIDDVNGQVERFLDRLHAPFHNAFENIVKAAPPIGQALDYLRTLENQTGTTARLTGTGSVVFLPIRHTLNDHAVRTIIANAPCRAVKANSLFGE
ncbi:MAG: 4-(cytidine 5'-diphospho)-2-C-methyl-D-erythritol kinase [Moraxella sp.]|nr:4-(cytidine 5'-diphospho)-2-C-methyl-D-erythritol kinase [Moraxella sp.]